MRIPRRIYAVYVRHIDGGSMLAHATANRREAKAAAASQEARPDINQIWTETFVHASYVKSLHTKGQER